MLREKAVFEAQAGERSTIGGRELGRKNPKALRPQRDRKGGEGRL